MMKPGQSGTDYIFAVFEEGDVSGIRHIFSGKKEEARSDS